MCSGASPRADDDGDQKKQNLMDRKRFEEEKLVNSPPCWMSHDDIKDCRPETFKHPASICERGSDVIIWLFSLSAVDPPTWWRANALHFILLVTDQIHGQQQCRWCQGTVNAARRRKREPLSAGRWRVVSQEVGFERDAWGGLGGTAGGGVSAASFSIQTLLVSFDGGFQARFQVRRRGDETPEDGGVLRAETHQVLERHLMERPGHRGGRTQSVFIQQEGDEEGQQDGHQLRAL